jgi:phosphoglycerate kinase
MSINPTGLVSIDAVEVKGKRVLLRADLNVPLADGVVTDATRIERVMPAIRALTSRGARVLLLSHFGRAKGKRRPALSLQPVAKKLEAMLDGTPVYFIADCIGPKAEKAAGGLADGEVAVLENLRFHDGEEANDMAFAEQLAALGDLYVNDAFSCAHRAHASTEAIAGLLPAFAGTLMRAEIGALRTALEMPQHPVAAVVGGAKVSTKIPVLTNLLSKVDLLVVGGGMANTFLHAKGIDVAKSLCEPDFADTARNIVAQAEKTGCRLALPRDAVVADRFEAGVQSRICTIEKAPADAMILDVGPKTIESLMAEIAACKTLLWNGPLGAFEIEPFGEGTFAVAREAARLTREGKLVTVAGGGDTVAALNAAGVAQDFTYVSTAGGAFLEWLEGKELPGVAALTRNQEHRLARSA